MEFACVFYDVFGVGGFTSLIRGRVLTILFWVFSQLRPIKTPTSKTQKKMHMKSVFDELELVNKMTVSSKTHKENETRTKKYDARMQWFELSTNDTIKLPT